MSRPLTKRKRLTEREARFAHSYVHDEPNATAAAIKAGYSKKTAAPAGSRLLRNVKVKGEIARLRREREQRTAVTSDLVITRLMEEANDRGESGTHSGRIRALELLGKHLGLFRDKLNVEVSGPSGEPVRVQVYIPDNGRDSIPDDDDLPPGGTADAGNADAG